ncbi:hypothetical protein ACMHYB_50390 [Sorangium sp. So ce1128]
MEPPPTPVPALSLRQRWPEARPGDLVIIGRRCAGEPGGGSLRWSAVVLG